MMLGSLAELIPLRSAHAPWPGTGPSPPAHARCSLYKHIRVKDSKSGRLRSDTETYTYKQRPPQQLDASFSVALPSTDNLTTTSHPYAAPSTGAHFIDLVSNDWRALAACAHVHPD